MRPVIIAVCVSFCPIFISQLLTLYTLNTAIDNAIHKRDEIRSISTETRSVTVNIDKRLSKTQEILDKIEIKIEAIESHIKKNN